MINNMSNIKNNDINRFRITLTEEERLRNRKLLQEIEELERKAKIGELEEGLIVDVKYIKSANK